MTSIKKIYGGPGTGKTTQLIALMREHIARGVSPDNIAYISHTKAAADEAWDRIVASEKNVTPKRPRYFCTIHAAARRMVGWPRQKIWGWKETEKLRELSGMKFRVGVDFDEREDIPVGDPIIQCLNFAAARMISLDDSLEMFKRYPIVTPDNVRQIAQHVADIKKDNDVRDFDDLLSMYYEHPVPLPVKVMFIDEAQDLSVFQWRIVEKMWGKADVVYICGDDDQSIYGFMGADPDGFLDYQCHEEEVLPVSWRCPKKIGAFAEKIISKVEKRKVKKLRWRDEPGVIERIHSSHDTLPIPVGKGSVKVLVRHQLQGKMLYRMMRQDGMAVSFNGESYLTGDESKVARIYMGFADKANTVSWAEGVRMMRAVPGREASVARMREAQKLNPRRRLKAEDFDLVFGRPLAAVFGTSFVQNALFAAIDYHIARYGPDGLGEEPSLQVMTMHASKGLEADHVIVLTDCYPAVWIDQEGELSDTERKVAYVAATRARHSLTLVEPTGDRYIRALVETPT